MPYTTYVDGNILTAAQLNGDNTQTTTDITTVTNSVVSKIKNNHFETFRTPNFTANGYFTGNQVVWKIPINNPLGNIQTCTVQLAGIIKNSSAPTYILEYSTDNSAWSTMSGSVSTYESSSAFRATGYVTGLTTANLYVRFRQSAGTSTPIVTSADITYNSDNGSDCQSFVYINNGLYVGNASDIRYITSTTATNVTPAENILAVDIVPPTGKTIKSISAFAANHWKTNTNSATNTMTLKYSTDDAGSWTAFAESNCTTASGNTGDDRLMAGYAMSTGLSLSKAKVSISQSGNANSTSNEYRPLYIAVWYNWG